MIILMFIFILLSPGPVHAPQTPIVEDGVYVGNQMPQWGEICEATDIYGNPRVPVDVYGSLSVGEVVPLHDLTMVGDVAWVSIHKARWIPLDSVCDW